MADPTFQVRGEPGHTHPEKRGGGGGSWVSKKKFLALQSSVWPQNKEGAHAPRAPPLGPSPGSTTDNNNSNNNTTTANNYC